MRRVSPPILTALALAWALGQLNGLPFDQHDKAKLAEANSIVRKAHIASASNAREGTT
jgi:hypothetical protein